MTNPGGLYGITVDRLGHIGTTSARNARLIEICRYSRSSDGARVVETLATGIPRVIQTLRASNLPDPHFHDTGIRFTVLLHSRPTVPRSSAVEDLSPTQRSIYSVLVAEELSVADIAARTGLQQPTIRKALRAMNDKGLTTQRGGRGRRTVYQRS